LIASWACELRVKWGVRDDDADTFHAA
jgi:hypothetical protein